MRMRMDRKKIVSLVQCLGGTYAQFVNLDRKVMDFGLQPILLQKSENTPAQGQ